MDESERLEFREIILEAEKGIENGESVNDILLDKQIISIILKLAILELAKYYKMES